MYRFEPSRTFKKQFKKLDEKDKALVRQVIEKLLANQTLDQKHKDHKLKGELRDFRECHIRPNLLLIYQLQKDILVLTCIEVGSHSELFGG